MLRNDVGELINQVKRVAAIPINQSTFTDDDMRELMNLEFQSSIIPWFLRVREEYLVSFQDFIVADNRIAVPGEAVGLRIRDLAINMSNGNFSSVPRLTIEQISSFGAIGVDVSTGQYGLSGFYLEGNNIVFYPSGGYSGQNVRVWYYLRPNELQLPAYAGVITDIVGPVVTVSNAPDTSVWTTGTALDAIEGETPFNFVLRNFDIVSRSGFDLTLSSADAAELSVGDVIATKGESPVVQFVPTEAYHLLVEGTAMRCLESMGDREGWANAAKKYSRMEQDLLNMISPRTDGEPKKIINSRGVFNASRMRTG